VAKKHVKPNPQRQEQGGIQDRTMPIEISNVMLWNAAAKKGDRVGFRTLGDGRKVRFFKSNKEVVDA
jgi:large subunit ribosomal protein L24